MTPLKRCVVFYCTLLIGAIYKFVIKSRDPKNQIHRNMLVLISSLYVACLLAMVMHDCIFACFLATSCAEYRFKLI